MDERIHVFPYTVSGLGTFSLDHHRSHTARALILTIVAFKNATIYFFWGFLHLILKLTTDKCFPFQNMIIANFSMVGGRIH